ncbi:MAG: Hpt domain-containing protein [Acidobacteria bacterium]|nr:Hpt domain-containing protein [Acidobacteriota bacterium]MBU4330773.1 Hpt domain-containing protein [Acidobacteriota bacterium]MCG2816973.1 Hpt domain-containing protein [Candidatus Aminicenantes bacterium]
MSGNQSDETNGIIDYPSALERTGDDSEFLTELLDLYVREFSPAYEKLLTAVSGKNFTAVREIGHGLKGSSANLSLLGLREAAYRMETAGREEDAAKAEKALADIEKEFQRLQEHLATR